MSAALASTSRGERETRLLAVFLAVSLIAHAAFLVAWLVLSTRKPAPMDLDRNIVKTRLVKLGKERDPNLLPRIDKSPPPPAPTQAQPAPVATPPAAEKPEAKPEPQKSAADILQQFRDKNETKSVDELIKERIGKPLDEGNPDGHKLGDDINGRLAAEYNDLLIARIHAAYTLPQTLTDEERIRLRAGLHIRIGADGALLEAELSPASGSSAFDSAVLAAARKAAPFSPPPIPLRDFYQQGGVLNFCPIRCQ